MGAFTRYKQSFKLALIAAFGTAIVWALYLHQTPARDTVWNYGFNIMNAVIYMIGGVAGLYYAISPRMPQDLRKALLYLGIGQLSWAMAALMWSYFNIFLKINEPYPSLSDFFFIMFMIDVSVGTMYILKHSEARISRRNALESILIIMVTYVVALVVVSPPVISVKLPLATAMFNFIYPVGDAFMVAIALAVYRLGSKSTLSGAKYLLIALLLQAVGDFLFGYVTLHNTYWNGDLADVIYTLSGFMLSASIISLAVRGMKATQ